MAYSWHFQHSWGSHKGAGLDLHPRKTRPLGYKECCCLIASSWKPLGSASPFQSRTRYSWAVTSQGLSTARHLVLAISVQHKRLPIGWLCSKAPYWRGRVCFRYALHPGWGSWCLVLSFNVVFKIDDQTQGSLHCFLVSRSFLFLHFTWSIGSFPLLQYGYPVVEAQCFWEDYSFPIELPLLLFQRSLSIFVWVSISLGSLFCSIDRFAYNLINTTLLWFL